MNLPNIHPVYPQRSSRRGQWFFSVMSHRLYEIGLYRFVTTWLWECPTALLLDNYRENTSQNHLEVGVGSGFFLRQTLKPAGDRGSLQRLVLVDLNARCLAKSAERLRDQAPEVQRQDLREPMVLRGGAVRSVGINYVLHCIKGSFKENRRVFAHLAAVLEEGGVLFGATLVARPLREGRVAWLLMKTLNLVGIFNNDDHRVDELKHALDASFAKVELTRAGNAVVFRAVR